MPHPGGFVNHAHLEPSLFDSLAHLVHVHGLIGHNGDRGLWELGFPTMHQANLGEVEVRYQFNKHLLPGVDKH